MVIREEDLYEYKYRKRLTVGDYDDSRRNDELVGLLFKMLDSEYKGTVRMGKFLMHKEAEIVYPYLIEDLKSKVRDSGRTHSDIAHVLGLIGRQDAIPEIVNAINDKKLDANEGISALVRIGGKIALKAVRDFYIHHGSYEYSGETELGDLFQISYGHTNIPKDLLRFGEHLTNDEEYFWPYVFSAFGEPGVEELIKLLDTKNDRFVIATINHLSYIDDGRVPSAIREQLKHKKSVVRATAAYSLGELKDSDSVLELIKLLRDKNEEVVENTLRSLILIQDDRSIPNFIEMLKNENLARRYELDYLLISRGDKAMPHLLKAVKNGNDATQANAARIISKIKSGETIRYPYADV